MVEMVIGLAHRSVTSRSLVEATVPGLKQPESPSTKGTQGWLRTLCVPTRPWLTNTSVGLIKLAPLDVMNPMGVLSRPIATADMLMLTWLESPVAQPRLPGGHPRYGWTSNRQSCVHVRLGFWHCRGNATSILRTTEPDAYTSRALPPGCLWLAQP